jgi:pyridoxine 5-phosphate synthase
MACDAGVLAIACQVKPDQVTLVPERREEVTTEGGLDVVSQRGRVSDVMARLRETGIGVSLFLDPDPRQIEAAAQLKADAVEIHTGQYALAAPGPARDAQFAQICRIGEQIRQSGMALHAGHGLTYRNVRPIAEIEGMHELNIGHSIIARAIMVGMTEAVREMKRLVS